jgi:hypothetical protein
VAKHAGLPDNHQHPYPHINAELLPVSAQYSFSCNSQIKRFPAHFDMEIFSILVCGIRALSLSAPFSYTPSKLQNNTQLNEQTYYGLSQQHQKLLNHILFLLTSVVCEKTSFCRLKFPYMETCVHKNNICLLVC